MQLCMLQYVDEMLDTAGISYWICGGTLLGAVRHYGFIPHDDDVDIECLECDLEQIAKIPLDPPLYTGFVPKAGTWEGHVVAKLKFFHSAMEVDVFPRNNKMMEHKHFPSRQEVFPLKRYTFCNIHVWGPHDAHDYLNRLYGNTWRDCVCVWNHDFNWYHATNFNPDKVVLSLSEYNTVVKNAGIVEPTAESCATETFQVFCQKYNVEDFLKQYQQYKLARVCRQNRAAAEWRESQQR